MRARRHAVLPSAAIVLAFLTFGLAPLAILTTSSVQLSKQAVERGATTRALGLNSSFAALIASAVNDVQRVMTTAGEQPAMKAAVQNAVAEPAQAQSALAAVLRTRPDLAAVLLTDAHGILIRGEPGLRPGGSRSVMKYWLPGASRSDQAYVSSSYLSPMASFGQVLAVAKRVTSLTDSNRTIGFLVGVYRLRGIQASVDQLRKAQGVSVTVTDQAGTVLSRPGKAANQLISLMSDERVSSALHGGHGVVSANGPDGPTLSAYGPVAALGWTVSVDIPERVAFAEYYSLRNTVHVVAVILAGLMLAAMFASARAQYRRRRLEQTSTDRTKQRAASEERFRAAFVHAPVGMVREALDGEILEVNKAFCDMLGMTEDELIGISWKSITHPDDLEDSEKIDASLPLAERAAVGEKRYVHKSGELVWGLVSLVFLQDATGEQNILAQVVEITDRKRAEAELSRQALHDSLTGLGNRLLAESRIDQAIARLDRDASGVVAVLFIDLDGFKGINDQLGHQVGDDVLRETGRRISAAVRPGDTVARLGGDEFLVVCEGLTGAGADDRRPGDVAARIRDVVATPGTSNGHSWQVSASIGISYAGVERATPVALIAAADAAMYDAKQAGKSCVRVYEPSMVQHKSTPGHSVALVNVALAQDRLRLHYQPVFDLQTRSVVGVEALLRMQDDNGRLMLPAEFLPAAQAHGHMIDFGAWVLSQACAQAARWRQHTGCDLAVGVNVSVSELEGAGFLHRVDRALEASGLPAPALVVELTESAFLRDVPTGRAALRGLHERGVGVSLDDFGTGFSSLSYLRRHPVDCIKIDRSFIADLPTDRRGALVTQGLIALAHSLETIIIAEGVEEEAQVEQLSVLGVHAAQGHLLARPMAADDVTAYLSSVPAAPVR